MFNINNIVYKVLAIWVVYMPSPKKFKTRLSKRGLINIPQPVLNISGIDIGSPVWIFSDGEIMVIKNIFPKSRDIPPPIFGRLRGAFKRFISR